MTLKEEQKKFLPKFLFAHQVKQEPEETWYWAFHSNVDRQIEEWEKRKALKKKHELPSPSIFEPKAKKIKIEN
jgi:hypothetical protein